MRRAVVVAARVAVRPAAAAWTPALRLSPLAPPAASWTAVTRPLCCRVGVSTISVKELAELLKGTESGNVQFVDVREKAEQSLAKVSDKFVNLPTSEMEVWCAGGKHKLDKTKKTVVMCRSGKRSLNAATALVAAGFTNVWNVDGGLLAYAADVDSTIPYYDWPPQAK